MKKRTVTSIALAAVLAASPFALTACSGDHYSSVSFPAQKGGIVTSQGGSTVVYGNYVYFINGTRGYEDTEGKSNVWNEVVKGALYRAELIGESEKDEATGADVFRIKADAKGMEFKYTETEDYFYAPVNEVNVNKIAPKTIGTTGYKNGGLFLYDNCAFFASPNNEKNATGTVQTTRTDFFMMPLKGGKPVKVYTTTAKVDTSSEEYAFYKYKGAVYLVVNEGGTIVSVRIDCKKGKADDPKAFEVNATGVYFPVRDMYYEGIDCNTPEDYIYYTAAVTDDDGLRAGNKIIAMRPNGSEQMTVIMDENTKTLEAVRDGVMFYRTTDKQNSAVIAYDNLYNARMEYSAAFRAAQEKLPETERENQVDGVFATPIADPITATYAFRADEKSNRVYFVAVTSDKLYLYRNDTSNPIVGVLAGITGTPQFIKENYLYFAGSASDYYRAPLFPNMEGFGTEIELAKGAAAATFGCDYAAGYFTYYGEVDTWASDYAYFLKVDGKEGAEPIFIGKRASFDIPTEEQLKAARGEEDEDEGDDDKE